MIPIIQKKISHLFHPLQGEIWCLHRVVPERSDYPSNRELEITPGYLEVLVKKYISEGYIERNRAANGVGGEKRRYI